MKIRTQYLEATFSAASADRNSRVVPLIFYSGATVERFNFRDGLNELRLSLDPKHVRLGRLNSGTAPFTRGHADANDPGAIIGVIERAVVENGKGVADVRFSKRSDVEPIYQDVLDGVIRNVSVEAALHELQDVTPKKSDTKSFLATDWEPTCVALVARGADPGAHINASGLEFSECEIIEGEQSMEENNNGTAVQTNPDAVEQIRRTAKACGLAEFGESLIRLNIGVDESRKLLLDRQAEENAGPPIRSVRAHVTRDYSENLTARMAEAVFCRYTGTAPSDGAREWIGARLSDMARELLIANGQRPLTHSAAEVIRLAHSTSDFPLILKDASNKMLLQSYTAAQSALKQVARKSSAADFKTKYVMRLGEAPELQLVPESAEITYGSRGEMAESYALKTYGRLFSISRQALVNDDLDAFSSFFRAYGVAAASLEAQLLTDLLYGASGVGPTMSDGLALFHSTHGNLAGSGAAISDTTLSAARLAMRTMKGLDAVTVIEVRPRFLVTPAAKETEGQKVLATLSPTTVDEVNPFSGSMTLVVEPRLDAKSAVRWYVFAGPEVPVLEYSYLDGADGPQVETRMGWEVLGQEFRAFIDFGAGVVDYRGAYSNPGQ